MLLLDSNDHMIKFMKKMLNKKFGMKDLGVADVILEIKISRTSNRLILSQSYYIEKILYIFFKISNSIVKILIDISEYLYKNKGK